MFNINCGSVEVTNNFNAGKFSGVETPEVIMDKDTMLFLCMSHNETMLYEFFDLYLSYKLSADSTEAFEAWVNRQNLAGVYRSPRYYAANYQLWLVKTGKVKPV